MPSGIGMAPKGGPEPEEEDDKGRGAWWYPSSYSPAASIGVGENGEPVERNGECELELVWMGIIRGG